MMKQFDHMIERKLNPRLKFLAGCGQFSDFSNNTAYSYKASGLKLYNISSAAIFLCLTWHPIRTYSRRS
jgi:hypothetical protein